MRSIRWNTPSPPPSKQSSSNRNCNECHKKPQQVQCLHCSQPVCVECAQKHVNSATDESETIVHLLNEKLDVLDRIAINTRQRIIAERDKIVQKADAERDRSFKLLAEMVEKEKQKLRDKNKELSELPLNERPTFIQSIKSDVQHLTDKDNTLFNISSKMPQIALTETASNSRNKFVPLFYSEEDYE